MLNIGALPTGNQPQNALFPLCLCSADDKSLSILSNLRGESNWRSAAPTHGSSYSRDAASLLTKRRPRLWAAAW